MSAEKLSPERLAEIAARDEGKPYCCYTSEYEVPALLAHIAAVEAERESLRTQLGCKIKQCAFTEKQRQLEEEASNRHLLARAAIEAERDALAATIARVEALRPSHLAPFDSSERSWWVRDDRLRAALRDEEAPK